MEIAELAEREDTWDRNVEMMQANTDISFTDIAEVYLQELRRGNKVSLKALAKEFPQYAKRILADFPTMAALESDLGVKARSLPTIPNYKLIEEIGSGNYGVVYKARHDSGRIVAVKLVQLDDNLLNIGRLDREIESLSRLRHPNIVAIEEFGSVENYVYIVTNLVEGIPLSELSASRPSLQGRYWVSELCNNWNLLASWGLEISSALEYIHQNKIIHRDIKPSNLLVDKLGKCWIVDFGLAKVTVNEEGLSLSQTGHVVGTPRFMAPEQLRGAVDPRSDIYSLGRTLSEIICAVSGKAERFRSSEHTSILALHPDLPQELGKIIDKASDPQVERRHQSAKELVAVFNRFLDGKTPCDRRRFGKRMTEQQFKAMMRRRVRFAIAGGIFSFLATSAVLVLPKLLPTPQAKTETILNPNPEAKESFRKLASVIENQDKGFIEVIGEALKHTVVSKETDPNTAEEVKSKIDRIVDKVTNEGLKPGELDSLIQDYRNSPLMNANRITALHQPLHHSTLNVEQKMRGHFILELFAKAVVNKRVDTQKADRLLASLFQGEIPRLETIVSLKIPDQVLASWLQLVETSFAAEFSQIQTEQPQVNEELGGIIDKFLQRLP